jgi:hypothetical protein
VVEELDLTPSYSFYGGKRGQPPYDPRMMTALAGLFLDVLRLCQEAGLVRLGHISLDVAKVKANASKHKAMSYGRMKKASEELEREISELLERVEATDSGLRGTFVSHLSMDSGKRKFKPFQKEARHF